MVLTLLLLMLHRPPDVTHRLLPHVRTKGLHYRVLFAGPRSDGIRGITDTGAHTITIYLSPGEPLSLVREVLAYEIAHAVDDRYLTDADREEFLRLRHAPSSMRWFGPDLAPEKGYGSGDFADCFADALTGNGGRYWHGPLPPPDRETLRMLMHRFFHQGG